MVSIIVYKRRETYYPEGEQYSLDNLYE